MNKIYDARECLAHEWGRFQASWHDSRAQWKDTVALDFERQFWMPIETEMPQFLAALEKLSDEISAAKRDLR